MGSGTSFHDANGNFIGDIFTEVISEPGAEITVERTMTRFETKNADGTITEKGSEYENVTLIRAWEFTFDQNYNLIKGSETVDGVTTTFGAGWKVEGESADTSSLQEVDLETVLLDTTKLGDIFDFSATVDGVATTKGYVKTKTMDWGDVETTYINAAGEIVGRQNAYEFTFVDWDGSDKTQKGASYHNAEGEWIGDTFNDDYMSGGRFEFQVDEGRREIGSETANDGSFSRTFDFLFKSFADGGNLISGTEVNNGVTTTYGPDWTITSQKMDTSGLEPVSAEELAYLPASFKVDGAPKYSVNKGPWGEDRTYFDASGDILGYSNSWSDPMGGSGISFNDPNWQFLGDIFEMKEGDDTFTHVRFETEKDGVRTETGSEYKNGVLERSWEFNFDGFEMVGGTETRADGVVIEFNPGWVVKSEKLDTSKLGDPIDLTKDLGNGVTLADIYDFSVDGVEAPKGYTTVNGTAGDGFIETVYYNQDGKIVGRADQNIFTPGPNDFTPPLTFFRADTKDGGWIDFIGVGVDGLVDGYDGQGILLPLDWSDDEIAADTTAAQLLDMFASSDFDQQIPAAQGYGPGSEYWFQGFASESENLTLDKETNEASGTLKGYVIGGINTTSPSAVGEVNVAVTTSDTLEYEYFWDGGQGFVSGLDNTTFTVGTTEVIQEAKNTALENPPTQTNYFDADFEFVGETFSGSQGDARTVFRVETADGYTEFGSEGDAYWSRSWEFNFKKVGQDYVFDGGVEKENGVEREVDASGNVTKEKIDPSALQQATDAQLSSLPSIFKTTVDVDGSAVEKAFFFEQKFPGGVDTFYFDDAGVALGRTSAWSDANFGGSGSGVDYFDASGKFFGSTYKDEYMEHSRIETAGTFEGQSVIVETGYEKFDGETREWTFYFSDDGMYEFLGGTETSGSREITFGKNWVIEAEKVDPTADASFKELKADDLVMTAPLLKIGDASSLSEGLVTFVDVFAAYDGIQAGNTIGYYQQTGSIEEQGFEEITYFDANGGIVGRTFENSWTFDGQTETRTEYLDADWNFLGEVTDGQFFDRSFFIVKTDAGYTEVSSESDDGGFSREAVFNFKAPTEPGGFGEFTGGFEIENGKTYTLDKNWSRTAEALSADDLAKNEINASNAGSKLFVDLDDAIAVLGDLADATNKTFVGEEVYKDANRGEQRIDIYDASGVVVGEIFTFRDWSGETVADFHAISPTEFKFLGQIRQTDTFKQITSESVVDEDGRSVEVRTTTRYSRDDTSKPWNEDEQIIDRFADGMYIGGSEKFDGVTTTFNEDGSVETKGDVDSLGELGVGANEKLSDIVVSFPGSPGKTITLKDLYYAADATKGFFSVENFGQSTKTTYYDADGNTVGQKFVDTFGTGSQTDTFVSYQDAKGHWIGDTFSNANFDRASFEIDNGETYTYYVNEKDSSDGYERYLEETYSKTDGKPLSGVEIENGVTTELKPDPNGGNFFVREAAKVDLANNTDIEIITDAAILADTPEAFIFKDTSVDPAVDTAVRLKVFEDKAGGTSYSDYKYYNAGGVELGIAFVDQYDYDNDGNVDEIWTNYNSQDGFYLGNVQEYVGQSKYVRLESRGVEGDPPVQIRTEKEYYYDGSDQLTGSNISVYNDNTGQFLRGEEKFGDTTITYGLDRKVEGETFSGSTSSIELSQLMSALPDNWTSSGVLTQFATDIPGSSADIDQSVDIFLDGNKVGNADVLIEYFVTGNAASGVKYADVTVYDNMSYDGPVGTTQVFTNDENVTTTRTSSTTKIPEVGQTIKSSEVRKDGAGFVIFERSEIENFDAFGNYIGGQITENGTTIIIDDKGGQTTNSAAYIDGNFAEKIYGTLSESGDTEKTGNLLIKDDDQGDIIVVDVANADHAFTVQKVDGLYGEFEFDTSTGDYKYTLDPTKAATLPNGAVVVDKFNLRIQDFKPGSDVDHDVPNQEVYESIKFEVRGEGDSGSSGALLTVFDAVTHKDVVLKEYTLTGYTFEAPQEGGTAVNDPHAGMGETAVQDPMAKAASMKIIGSDDLQISQTVLTVGEDDIPQMNVTQGHIFDIEIDGASVAALMDVAQLGLTKYEGSLIDGTPYSTLVKEIYIPFTNGAESGVQEYVFYVQGDKFSASGVPSDEELFNVMADAESGQYFEGPLLALGFYDHISEADFTGTLLVDEAFSLALRAPGDITSPAPVEFDFAGTKISAGLSIDQVNSKSLNADRIEIAGARIDEAINQNKLGMTLKLDQVAKFASSKVASVTVTVRDVNANIPPNATEYDIDTAMVDTVGTREIEEREISMTFEISVDGNGTSASVKTAQQLVSVDYYGSGDPDGSPLSADFQNNDEDVFNISGNSNLNIKLASLIGKMKDVIGKDVLSKKGMYEFEISGLNELLEEGGEAISTITGLIDVTSDGGAVTPQAKFSLDHINDPVTFAFDSGDKYVNLEKHGNELKATQTLGINSSDIDKAIKDGKLDVSLKLDKVANINGTITKPITVTFRDVEGSPEASQGTLDTNEREISLTFNVDVSGDGHSVSVESLAGSTIDVSYVKGGLRTDTSFTNSAKDLVSLNGTTHFDIKLSALLEKMKEYVDQTILMDVGLYEYEISGLQDLLEETKDGVTDGIAKITGLIDVSSSGGGYPVGQNPFSIDISPHAKNEVTIGTDKIEVSVQYLDLGYRVDEIDVDLPSIEKALDGGNFGVSFAIDQIAKLESEITQQIYVRLRDVNEVVGTLNPGERELEIYFDVKFSGNGTNGSVQSIADSPIDIYYKNALGNVTDLSQTNADIDLVSFNAGTQSMDFDLGSLLSRVEGVFGDGALSQVGSYEYKIFLKDNPNLLGETLGGTLGPVQAIEGVINVNPGSPILDGSKISYDPDGDPGTVNSVDVDLAALLASDAPLKLASSTVNELGNPMFNIAPQLSLKVADELLMGPEGAQNWSETFRIDLIEDNGTGDETVRESGEMAASVEFTLELAKIGDDLIVTAPANAVIDVDIMTSSNNNVGFELRNGDVDQFVIAKSAVSNAPASLNIKLDSIMEKAEQQIKIKGLEVPNVYDGDEFYLEVSNVINSGGTDVVEPMLDIAILIEDPLVVPTT